MEEAHPQSEGWSHAWHPVDAEASLVVRDLGCTTATGRMSELSLDGCCVLADGPLQHAAPAAVEVSFKVNGIGFRLAGTMDRIDAGKTMRIRFGSMAPRRRRALEDLLNELEAEEQAEVAAEEKAAEVTPDRQLPSPVPITADLAESGKPQSAVEGPLRPAQERRAQARHALDSRATLYFIDVRARIPGQIVDVSLGGCRIRTFERFPLGIYRRVETEFNADGLPFRLAGVVQVLHNSFTVGIRFLNMSPRTRDQLAQLIEEMEETSSINELQ